MTVMGTGGGVRVPTPPWNRKQSIWSTSLYLVCLTKIAAGVGCAALLLAGDDAPLSVATAVASDDCTALTQTPSRRRGFIGCSETVIT